MPILSDNFYQFTGNAKTEQYIETGTYQGKGIEFVYPHYEKIHSIELSKKWYYFNKEKFNNDNKVAIYFGNSKVILPKILRFMNEPITIYLDAHFSAGETACEEVFGPVSSTPLLEELEILKNREYDDLIIIDDGRMIGAKGIACKGMPTTSYWPEYHYDWTEITEEKISELLKPGYKIFKNSENSRICIDYENSWDQWIIARSNN